MIRKSVYYAKVCNIFISKNREETKIILILIVL